jgi:hypothetical protein
MIALAGENGPSRMAPFSIIKITEKFCFLRHYPPLKLELFSIIS